MPIYEYVCRTCGNELERLQKLSDEPLTECPECGESALKRKVSAAGFRLAGGGWYETDFKSDGRHNIAGDKRKSSDDKGANDKNANDKSANDKSAKSSDGKDAKAPDKTSGKKEKSTDKKTGQGAGTT